MYYIERLLDSKAMAKAHFQQVENQTKRIKTSTEVGLFHDQSDVNT